MAGVYPENQDIIEPILGIVTVPVETPYDMPSHPIPSPFGEPISDPFHTPIDDDVYQLFLKWIRHKEYVWCDWIDEYGEHFYQYPNDTTKFDPPNSDPLLDTQPNAQTAEEMFPLSWVTQSPFPSWTWLEMEGGDGFFHVGYTYEIYWPPELDYMLRAEDPPTQWNLDFDNFYIPGNNIRIKQLTGIQRLWCGLKGYYDVSVAKYVGPPPSGAGAGALIQGVYLLQSLGLPKAEENFSSIFEFLK
jgi:hypothetical protein